ncbi:uncharacterized protein LOC141858189 [Brevipalpus obovatus]|uniref:uncharacterized protein LOC141858189 n=1 Tax=Brevipalpus obovatus TaxID=246614 RepID=UPI003D9F2A9B
MEEEWQHRFKVVKIAPKEPRKRGRWSCMDFNDPPPTFIQQQQTPTSVINSSNTSNVSSVNATTTTTVNNASSVASAPGTVASSTASNSVAPNTNTTSAVGSNNTDQSSVNQSPSSTNADGNTGGSVNIQNQVDNRSSTANHGGEGMVVDEKTFDHLMFAVREEVVVLKERINELMSKISQLECENGILKAHASPEVLLLVQQSKNEQLHLKNQNHEASNSQSRQAQQNRKDDEIAKKSSEAN